VNQSPRVLGNRYEVGDLLGRGGMAEVHLGRDTRLGRVVAIKLLRTDLARDPVFQARFRREAQSAAGLNHPAVVAVYDTGEESVVESGGSTVALPYIVMEYVEGRTLRDVLREGDPMDPQHALEVTIGVLSALDYSHRMGIVHRDIKPANVMLTANGDIKVMDFGIARALADVSATMTQTQAVIGTAQYLSPEQARGETVDARSDLYSAGCLLFELMTGRPPFVADSPVAVAYQHVREAPLPPSAFNPRIPEVVDRIVLHALAKDREARYQTANDFRADLEAALAGRQVAATTVALTAPGQGGGLSGGGQATEYLPQPAAATQAFGPGGYPGGQGYGPGPGGQGYGGQGYGPGQGGYPQQGGPFDGWNGGTRTDLPYPPPPEEGYGRRGDRRAAAAAGATSRRIGFVVLALVVVALFAGAAYGVSYLVSQNSAANAPRAVPAVSGLPRQTAIDRLTKLGFNVLPAQEASDTVPAGNATRTDPTGTQPPGTRITLYLSTGSANVPVPELTGLTRTQAEAKLRSVGLVLNPDLPEQPVEGGVLAKGLVVNSDPDKGVSVAKGTKVTLNVSSGKINVPEERGKNVEEAKQDLESKGITVDIVIAKVFTTDQPDGTVIDQDPLPGLKVATKITLTVATTPPADPSQTDPGQTDPNGGNQGQGNNQGNNQGQGNQGNGGQGNGGGPG